MVKCVRSLIVIVSLIPFFLQAQRKSECQLKLYGTGSFFNRATNFFPAFDQNFLFTSALPATSINGSIVYSRGKHFLGEIGLGYITRRIHINNILYDYKNPDKKVIWLTLFSLNVSLGYKKKINETNSFIFILGPGLDIRIGNKQKNLFTDQLLNIYPYGDYLINSYITYGKSFTPVIDLKMGISSQISNVGQIETGVRFHLQTQPNNSAIIDFKNSNYSEYSFGSKSNFRMTLIGIYFGWILNLKNPKNGLNDTYK